MVLLFFLDKYTHQLRVQQSAFVGAIAVGDLVKSTYGPKGMVRSTMFYGVRRSNKTPVFFGLLQDKILQSLTQPDNVTVTNDGATILKSIALDNAAAKVLVSK